MFTLMSVFAIINIIKNIRRTDKMKKIKILIADDIEIIAKTIKSELEKIEDVEIVGIAKDGEEEIEK